MDGTATAKLRKNPERTANPFSRIFFCYVWPLMWRGYTCEMEPEDLPECVPHDESELCYKQLKSAWEREKALRPVVCDAETEPEIKSPEEKDSKKDRKKSVAGPSLGRALWSVHGTALLGLGVLLLLEEFVRLVQPLFLGGLVRYFRYDHPLSVNQAYFYASGIAICAALYPTIHHPFFYALQKCGLRMKVATSALVFDKALQLSSSALHSTSVGYVINLLSTDVSRFDFGLIFLHYIWVSPLMLIGYVILLWRELGPSCLAGFGALAVLVPIQGYFSRNMGRCRREIAARADKRIGLMSEILNGIRVIKMYAWEPAFAHLVHQARKRELRMVKKFAVWQSLVLGTFWASGRVVILSFLLAFLLAGNEVTAEKVFVSAALFNASRVPLTLFLPLGLQFFFEMKVAIDRLQKFLLLEEGSERTLKFRYGTLNTWRIGLSLGDAKTTLTEKSLDSTGQTQLDLSQNGVLNGEASQSEIDPLVDEETEIGNGVAGKDLSGEPFVHMVDYTAKWNDESASFGIENICLEARPGRLVAIIGPVGAGKSTILNAILGETMRKSGTLRVHGRVAYVPQEAWVFGATLQQNITFGMAFEQGAYDRAVRQAALTKDLKLLPMGDQTAVGDRGASLSGGQKARVNLARALYRDADVYLLDDPLSAVDSAVGRYLFDRCIKSLKANKVVILVTHQLQYLNAADFVLLVKDGKCVASGPLDQLKREHPMEFEQVVAEAEQTFKKEQSPRRRLLSQSSVDSQNRRRYATGASTGTVGTARAESVRASSECESLPPPVPLPDANATALAGNNLSDSACSLALGQSEVNAHADDLELDKTAETVEQAEIADVLDASDSEERASGAVDWRIYWSYVCAMSGMPGLVLLALFVVGVQLLMCSCDWTTGSEQQRAFSKLNKTQIHQLSNCTDNNSAGSGNGTLKPECFDGKIVVPTGWYAFSQYDYLDVYAVICGLLVVGSVARVIWFRFFQNWHHLISMHASPQVNASRRLHGRMFNAIVRTKVFFFDANPVGRVLNRFSKDTNAMDEQLAFVFFEFIQGALLFASIVLVIGALNPYAFVPTVPLMVAFFLLRIFYLHTSRDLKRLEATSELWGLLLLFWDYFCVCYWIEVLF